MEILLALCSEFVLIFGLIILSFLTPYLCGIIIGAFFSYLLPAVIILGYLYLLFFETSVYNIPNILQENLNESIYFSFLFIIYIVYISVCQI